MKIPHFFIIKIRHTSLRHCTRSLVVLCIVAATKCYDFAGKILKSNVRSQVDNTPYSTLSISGHVAFVVLESSLLNAVRGDNPVNYL